MNTPGPSPSVPLTRAIARGDETAFATFYDIWFDRAYAVARSLTGRDESFCLDVVQDCMMTVVRKMRPLATEAAVAAWMARTVTNRAVDRLRAERRRTRRETDAAQREAMAADQEDEVQRKEHLAWLHDRLAELPEQDRAMIAARFEQEQTLAATGAALGLSLNAVHGRVRRIVDQWRDRARRIFDV